MFPFFTASESLPSGAQPVEFLYPYWGAPVESRRAPTRGRYDRWVEHGPDAATPTSLEEADMAVFPGKWEQVVGDDSVEIARQFAQTAQDAGVPSAVFFWSDSLAPVALPGTTVFRTALVRSARRPNELAMPSWSEDFAVAHLGGAPRLRPRSDVARVGFCGFAGSDGRGDRFRRVPGGSNPRAAALRNLLQSRQVETNFVLRWRFRAGGRRAYVRNMVDSDYILCVRGAGNYSYRLYETLSCGRIPVFVDTDCVLPADDLVDWRQICVWIDESEIGEIGDRIAEFHAGLSPSDFTEMQVAARRAWETHIAPHAFFAQLGRHFT